MASYYREKEINTYLKQQIVFIDGGRDVRIAIRLFYIESALRQTLQIIISQTCHIYTVNINSLLASDKFLQSLEGTVDKIFLMKNILFFSAENEFLQFKTV